MISLVWLASFVVAVAGAQVCDRFLTEALDPRRPADHVRAELLARGALAPATPLDRVIVADVLARCCGRGLHPEVAWRIDDRWVLHRDPPRTPRLYTADLAFAVGPPALARVLDERVAAPQLTIVDDAGVTSCTSVHRLSSTCRALRRVEVNGRAHHAPVLGEFGYDDAPAGVRAMMHEAGLREQMDPSRARRRWFVPRFSRWRGLGDLRFTELRLNSEAKLSAGDVTAHDLPRRYVNALADGTVPLIIDRWEMSPAVRHALGATRVPRQVLEWFRALATVVIYLETPADERRAQALATLRENIFAQFEGVLDLATLAHEGRLDRFDDFLAASRPIWSTLVASVLVPPARVLAGDLEGSVRRLSVAHAFDDSRAPTADERRTLEQIHRFFRGEL